jgi:hypothetical protein
LAVAEVLIDNDSLVSLNLGVNAIGDSGAHALCVSLRLNRTLLNLSLASNRIFDTGAQAVASLFGTYVLSTGEVSRRRLAANNAITAAAAAAAAAALLSAGEESGPPTSARVRGAPPGKAPPTPAMAPVNASASVLAGKGKKEEKKPSTSGSTGVAPVSSAVGGRKGAAKDASKKDSSQALVDGDDGLSAVQSLAIEIVQTERGEFVCYGNDVLASLNLSCAWWTGL